MNCLLLLLLRFLLLHSLASTLPNSNSFSDFGSISFDIEQPRVLPPAAATTSSSSLQVLASMTRTIYDVAQTRSMLKVLGDRPDHKDVDNAKAKLADLTAHLLRQLEEIVKHISRIIQQRLGFWFTMLSDFESTIQKDASKSTWECGGSGRFRFDFVFASMTMKRWWEIWIRRLGLIRRWWRTIEILLQWLFDFSFSRSLKLMKMMNRWWMSGKIKIWQRWWMNG